jgi:hypothetical protein
LLPEKAAGPALGISRKTAGETGMAGKKPSVVVLDLLPHGLLSQDRLRPVMVDTASADRLRKEQATFGTTFRFQ